MAANPILEKWRAGEPTLGGWMVTDDPQVAEFLAQAGFDEICVDQQHGLADQSTIGALFRAIELHGVAPTTRVPSNDAAMIDYSRVATFASSDPSIADVTPEGMVVPRGNGTVEIRATHIDQRLGAGRAGVLGYRQSRLAGHAGGSRQSR